MCERNALSYLGGAEHTHPVEHTTHSDTYTLRHIHTQTHTHSDTYTLRLKHTHYYIDIGNWVLGASAVDNKIIILH
jgi:hypothetical protein